jgi:23S rRNA (adenine2030-N6)-methyltransferase
MLSYRHAFHAGNHADVLKHYIFSLVLDYFNQKDKPYWVIDTHAGAGMYSLQEGFAQKNAEYTNGIQKLLNAPNIPESFTGYLNAINHYNTNGDLRFYPGSPNIASHFLRPTDKLRLFELHPSDYQLLTQNFSNKQTQLAMQNGFDGIKACLPPPTKRGMVLIDPPYELKEDYQLVVSCIKDSLKRFATGTYLIWYPLLQKPDPQQMINQLKSIPNSNWLNATLTVQQPSANGYGMHGSGIFAINPPWTLPNILQTTLPWLTQCLGQDTYADFSLEKQLN